MTIRRLRHLGWAACLGMMLGLLGGCGDSNPSGAADGDTDSAIDRDTEVSEDDSDSADCDTVSVDGDQNDVELCDYDPEEGLPFYSPCTPGVCSPCAQNALCRYIQVPGQNDDARCTTYCANGCPDGYECYNDLCTASASLHTKTAFETCRSGQECLEGLSCMEIRGAGEEPYALRCTISCDFGSDTDCPDGAHCYKKSETDDYSACMRDEDVRQGAYYARCRYDLDCQTGYRCFMIPVVLDTEDDSYAQVCTAVCESEDDTLCPQGSSCYRNHFADGYTCMRDSDVHKVAFGGDCGTDIDCADPDAFCGWHSTCTHLCDSDSDCSADGSSLCIDFSDFANRDYCYLNPTHDPANHLETRQCVPLEDRNHNRGGRGNRLMDEACGASEQCAIGLQCAYVPVPNSYSHTICLASCENAPCDSRHECAPLVGGDFCVPFTNQHNAGYRYPCMTDDDCAAPYTCQDSVNPTYGDCLERVCYGDAPDGDK